MIRNYFKTAWRSLVRNKVFSALNIVGLATGMAVALLIGLWVVDQSSFDRWLPGYTQAFQVRYNYSDNGVIRTTEEVCLPLGKALKNDIPEVAYVSPAFGPVANSLAVGTKMISPMNLIAGADFLHIFRFPMLEGDPDISLKNPSSIVLTESTARALFGRVDPLNKIVLIFNSTPLQVTGVLKNLPANSSFHFDYITTFSAFENTDWVKAAKTNWNDTYFHLYAGLRPNSTYTQAEAASSLLVKKYAPATYRSFQQQVVMQPLKDWHLYTDFQNGAATGGLIDYMRLFGLIGILVLLIACINFMNLSTARSEKRAREVGVRKVIGSSRGGLIGQFLTESVIVAGLAFLLSLLLVQLALPTFNMLTKAALRIPWSNSMFWLIMVGYILVTGLLAGSKPAFYLSSFQAAQVLKGNRGDRRLAILSRKALVVTQFSCSIGLIVSAIIIYQQIQYARNRPAGYDPSRLVETTSDWTDYAALKQAVLATGVVSSMTKSTYTVAAAGTHSSIDNWPGKLPNEPLSLSMNATCDTDYFRTVGMVLQEGRNFTGNFGVDSLSAILNEAAVRRMRLKNPVGQMISWSPSNGPHRLQVIGVVKDALTHSPFAAAEPAIYVFQPSWTFIYAYRLAPTVNTGIALSRLKPIFEQYNTHLPFDYRFADQDYAASFDFEVLIGKLAGIFAALAVFISCLGLFGLAAYMVEQRTKEIGIRKVLGASISQLVFLLTRDFVILVGIACVIASPIAFYLLHHWLQSYYYRISIGPGVFIASAVAALLITVISIGFQAVKAALAKPAMSLRSE